MSGPEVITLGCRLNLAESATLAELAHGEDDLVIVNSCAVTNEAVRQTRQAIRRAKRARPEARIVVTGCAAQVEPERFAAMPEVSRVVGNTHKLLPASFENPFAPSEVEGLSRAQPRVSGLGSARRDVSTEFIQSDAAGGVEGLDTNGSDGGLFSEIRVSDIMAVRETAPHLASAFSERSRAFIEVQNGCDHRCTFCIIPFGRGNSRSVPAGAVVERIKALVGEGAQEVVLTGVDVTSYGPDLPGAPTLGSLIERILRHVPELPRLRLSSLDCIEIDERLEDIIAHEPRFMPHLHMSFQAGDDMVLKRMKRRHSRAQSVETVQRLKAKRPGLAIGADLIAGFPSETDEMAENSLRLIDECDIVMGHIFPYSPRAGTPAARMPQVAAADIKARARRLREASARRRDAWLQSLVGTRQRVLAERGGTGHAENFAPVRLNNQEVGTIVDVMISGMDSGMLIGSAL
ncbi:MAG TPA: tRNA (N(6)-L-threonylcarbamoyladenosine(37)-C(2))-methylthiotransferase MtaB [Allosphingosinicella sp.]